MLELSKEQIRRLAIDDTTYNRGVRYYRSKTVSNVTWSQGLKQYQAVVHGKNDYRVTIRLNEDETDFCYNCNCPSRIKHQGACKHVVAMLLFLSDYIRMMREKPEEEENMAAFRIIHYFQKHEETIVYGDKFDIAVTVSIMARENAGTNCFCTGISIRAGAGKLYKIQNLKSFLEALFKEEEIRIGKQFHYIPGESSFTPRAKKILDFLLEIYEILERDGKTVFSHVFSKAQLILADTLFARFMKVMRGQYFTLCIENGTTPEQFEHICFKEENPAVYLDIQEADGNLYLSYHEGCNLLTFPGTKKYFFDGETVYAPQPSFLKTFLPFFIELKKQEIIVFRGKQKEQFLSSVLLPLYEQVHLSLPDSIKKLYVKEELKVSCYVGRKGMDISLYLEFHYGSHVMNPLHPYEDGFIVIRDFEQEQVVLNLLNELMFFPYGEIFLLRDEEAVYFFLTEGCMQLAAMSEVYYDDSVRRMRSGSISGFQAMVRINQDLVELHIDSDELAPDDLRQIFYSMKIKKKYHRLKNGNFLELDDAELKKLKHLMDVLDLSWKDIKYNTIATEKCKVVYVKEALKTLECQNISFSQEYQDYMQSILGENRFILPEVSQMVTASLRSYQREGFAWLKRLAEHSMGGILADDMGLGKTLQAITYICDRMEHEEGRKGLFLVICPTSLAYNWKEEFEKFAPSVVVKVVCGAPKDREQILKGIKEGEVAITSYPLVRRDVDLYQNIIFDTIFIDEAQYIKNPGSLSSRMVKRLKSEHRFALTGTPIENSLGELWSIFNFVMPNYLPRYSRFQILYEKPIMNGYDGDALQELERYIQPFMLRRMKKEVLEELPDKIEAIYMAEMTKEQEQLYQSYLYQMRSQIYGENSFTEEFPNRLVVLSALTRLRQICCHPASFLENYEGGSGKYELLMGELLPELLKSGHRVLVFSQFTTMLELIARGLERKHISYYRLEGSTAVEDRRRQVEDFNHGNKSVFLISLKAGGTGLNLTGADTVIHFDPWWNPAVEEQAEDRAYRIGQEKNVQVIRLLTGGTIEEKIYEMQKRKQELSETVISAQDIRELFV